MLTLKTDGLNFCVLLLGLRNDFYLQDFAEMQNISIRNLIPLKKCFNSASGICIFVKDNYVIIETIKIK